MSLATFPHVVIDDWFDADLLHETVREFPSEQDYRWRRCRNEHELKFGGGPDMWGPATRDYFAELAQRDGELAEMFDLPPLTLESVGGGYHLIPPGGFLDVHTDFSRSPETGRYRRLNVLTFLNPDWSVEDGGQLEFWADGHVIESIPPEFGRTVAFVTSGSSWHGHPTPTTRRRLSLAGYFFSEDQPAGFREQSTVWLES